MALAAVPCALALPMALAPLAAFTDEDALRLAVLALFSAQSLLIFLLALWLTLAPAPPAVLVRRAAFLVLVLAAGLVGLGMLAAPGATGRFFSWELAPQPLAAFAGGVYVGSAAVYGVALSRGWREVRPLVAGAALLSVSVLAATLAHLDTFDLDRLQAWAWVVLFAAFAATMLALLAVGERTARPRANAPLPRWVRAVLLVVAALLGVLALALWADPTALAATPFTLPPLGGRFAGCWLALLATLAAWVAWRNRAEEARLPALALVALPTGALAAGLRTIADLDPSAPYLAVLALLATTGLAVLARLARAR